MSSGKKRAFYSPEFIERMIAGERAHIALHSYLNYTNTLPKGINMDSSTIKMSYQGFPVEFHIEFVDSEQYTQDVIDFIDIAKAKGFTAPVQYNKTGDDILGMKGTVKKVSKGDITAKGLQMYIVQGELENGKEFAWNEFTPTTFRVGDAFKVAKNDRGFKVGEIILPEPEGGKGENIPF